MTHASGILIVEDESIIAKDIQIRLETLGYVVTGTAASGSAALAAAAKVRPDLVLMDIKLRGKMDGVEAAVKFRTEIGIPVIFLTSHSDERTLDRVTESEPYGYIRKPIETIDLRIEIEMALVKHAAEMRLRQSEERWRFSLDGSNDGIWDWNVAAGTVYYSPRWLDIAGVDQHGAKSDIAVRTARIHPDDAGQAEEQLRLLMNGGAEQFSMEYRLRRDDQSFRWIFERGKVIGHTAEGKPLRIIAACSDITQKREIEEKMRRQNAALVEANEVRVHLLGIASHDLKTPLSNIIGVIGMYEQDPRISEAAQYIKGLAERMLMLVKDLLDTAALHSGKLELHPSHVDLHALMENILSEYRPFAAQKQQTITYGNKLAEPTVLADRMLLKLAIENLLGNAVKYSAPGKTIHVSLEPNRSAVRISVKDEGPGLSEEDKPKLFGYFQKLSPQPTGGEVSTGMGLYIVKQIMELHNGSAGVESELGKGSAFFLELKREDV